MRGEPDVRVARLEERDKSQRETLASIKKGIERIEERLSKHLPCEKNELRLGNLEGTVNEDHAPRIDTVESHWDKLSGRMMVLRPLFILASNIISGLVVAKLAGLL